MSKLLNVFVYGTLKRGQPNHHWICDSGNGFSKFLGEGHTTKSYPLVVATRYNIPFMLDKEGIGCSIKGEVYEVDEKMMAHLDTLEDYPKFYDREIQDIKMGLRVVPCWVYIIRNFPSLLLNRKFLQQYENSQETPYCERLDRDPNISALDDLHT